VLWLTVAVHIEEDTISFCEDGVEFPYWSHSR
jgi:hypothetical protein